MPRVRRVLVVCYVHDSKILIWIKSGDKERKKPVESELVSRGRIWGSGSSEILVKILSCENDMGWNL